MAPLKEFLDKETDPDYMGDVLDDIMWSYAYMQAQLPEDSIRFPRTAENIYWLKNLRDRMYEAAGIKK
jgi:hypothetical protein